MLKSWPGYVTSGLILNLSEPPFPRIRMIPAPNSHLFRGVSTSPSTVIYTRRSEPFFTFVPLHFSAVEMLRSRPTLNSLCPIRTPPCRTPLCQRLCTEFHRQTTSLHEEACNIGAFLQPAAWRRNRLGGQEGPEEMILFLTVAQGGLPGASDVREEGTWTKAGQTSHGIRINQMHSCPTLNTIYIFNDVSIELHLIVDLM